MEAFVIRWIMCMINVCYNYHSANNLTITTLPNINSHSNFCILILNLYTNAHSNFCILKIEKKKIASQYPCTALQQFSCLYGSSLNLLARIPFLFDSLGH